jgi:hypothetical protein
MVFSADDVGPGLSRELGETVAAIADHEPLIRGE